MAVGDLANLRVGVEVDPRTVDRGLRSTEQRVRSSADKMKRDIAAGGGIFGPAFAIGAVVQGAVGALKVATIGMAIFRGETEKAREAIFSLPLGLGQVAKAVDDLADAIEGPLKELDGFDLKRIARGDAEQSSIKKLREQGINRREALTKEIRLAPLRGEDLERAQVEETAKERTRDLLKRRAEAFKTNERARFREEFQAEERLIEQARQAALAKIGQKRPESISATGVGLRVPGVNREPADKRGQDKTNTYLETMIQLLRVRAGVARAG